MLHRYASGARFAGGLGIRKQKKRKKRKQEKPNNEIKKETVREKENE